ncbi:MAG: 1-acyl-sn-glycerol-3-phosphate acyltransferase [Phycisphaeraceae bacterium]|nr:MAG: 1-acyl-sn-glycerol-3-phosphate acyltransferase [Phycisphaeraceae bacterium]
MFDSIRERTPSGSVLKAAFYGVGKAATQILCSSLFLGRAFHGGRVPARGPVLIAANHQSFLDPPYVGSHIYGRQLAFIARSGLFRVGPSGWILSALNSIPINEEGAGDAAAIRTTLRVLDQGHAVLIFPEGSRTPDGQTKDFKRGVALLVKRSRCPVVPAAVEGNFDAWPISRPFPRLFGPRVAVMYGEPIPHDELIKDGSDAALDRLRREIEGMRAQLRALLRRHTYNVYPVAPGDPPLDPAAPRLFGPGSYTAPQR